MAFSLIFTFFLIFFHFTCEKVSLACFSGLASRSIELFISNFCPQMWNYFRNTQIVFHNQLFWQSDIYFPMVAFCLHLHAIHPLKDLNDCLDCRHGFWALKEFEKGRDHHRIKLFLKLQCSKAASIKHGARKKERWGWNDGEQSNRLSEVVEVSICVHLSREEVNRAKREGWTLS